MRALIPFALAVCAAVVAALWDAPVRAPESTPPEPRLPETAEASRTLERWTAQAEPVPAAALVARLADEAAPTEAWIWAAVGRLRAEPELADAVADRIRRPHTGLRARELGLDLLAHAGTPESQVALRDVLGDPAVQADRHYPAYLQRLAFVRRPDADTAEFARALVEDPRFQRTAAYAAGGVAAQALAAGAPDRFEVVIEPVRALLDAPEPQLRAAALGGLGNAAHPEDRHRILAATVDPDGAVRAAAAQALRKYRDAEDDLVRLLEDPLQAVQRAALDGLVGRSIGARALAGIAERAARPLDAHRAALVNVLAAQPPHPERRRALLNVLAQSAADAHLRMRIRRLLR